MTPFTQQAIEEFYMLAEDLIRRVEISDEIETALQTNNIDLLRFAMNEYSTITSRLVEELFVQFIQQKEEEDLEENNE